jgi:hypothetical protein
MFADTWRAWPPRAPKQILCSSPKTPTPQSGPTSCVKNWSRQAAVACSLFLACPFKTLEKSLLKTLTY